MKPKRPPAPGFVWVKVLSGPDKGEWTQVLRREYQTLEKKR